MDVDITSILANLIFAATVYGLMKARLDSAESRVKELEDKNEAAVNRHIADLRDWAGIDPRFQTWKRLNVEEDTRRLQE